MFDSRFLILGSISLGAHIGLGAWLGSVRVEPRPEPVVVELRTVERPKTPAPPPPPPPPEAAPAPKAPPRAAPKAAPAPPAAPAPAAAAPDFGIALSGSGGGPGGIAVPVGQPGGGKVRQAEARTLSAPAAKGPGECTDAVVKAKALSMPHPAYTEEARTAEIEGKVRVELTVDAEGQVSGARVLEGLGHGLDEAAMAAVKGATFTPASACGKPVSSTFVVSVRFTL